MKNLKVFIVSVIVMLAFPNLIVQAKEPKTYKNEDGYTVVSYESLRDVPTILPDCDIIEIQTNGGDRTKGGWVFGSYISKEYSCNITLSFPDIKELSYYELEMNHGDFDRSHSNNWLMVTVESFGTGVHNDILAKSELFIFDNAEMSAVYITFSKYDTPRIYASNKVARVSFYSRERSGSVGDNVPLYLCNGTSVDNYSDFHYISDDKDVEFSYTEVYLSSKIRKGILDSIDEYHTYLKEKESRTKWHKSFKKFWKDKNRQEFDLAGYAKSLGYNVSTEAINDPFFNDTAIDKRMVMKSNNHELSVTCGKRPDWLQGYTSIYTDVCLDGNRVSCDGESLYSDSVVLKRAEHFYRMRESDLTPILVGDGYYISGSDFDLLMELLSYYN